MPVLNDIGDLEKKIESDLPWEHQVNAPTCLGRPEPNSAEKQAPARRIKTKWSKASKATTWQKLYADLSENYPVVLKLLWTLMQATWKKQCFG